MMVSLSSLAQKIGQAASTVGTQIAKFAKDPVDHVRRGFFTVKSEAMLFKQLLSLTPKEMQDSVVHLNEMMQVLCFGNGEGVVFHLRHFNPDNPIWQKSIKIACYKINYATRTAKITRILSLRQFWIMKEDILEQTQFRIPSKHEPSDFRDATDVPNNNETPGPITTQTILDRVEEISEQEECCICMENSYEVSLPCAHSFCKACIETWNDEHQTCPMCRNQIASNDEFWEIEGAPNQEEFGRYVVRLASGS